MKQNHQLSLMLGLTVFITNCSGPKSSDEQQTITAAITGYGTKPNGTGVHIGSTQPESWFGLAQVSATWFMNGFSKHSDGTYWATGYYNASQTLLSAEAPIVSAERAGVQLEVQGISTSGSRLSIDVRDASGTVTTLQHSDLVGLQLLLHVPDPTGRLSSPYYLRFSSAASVDSQFGDVDGYQIEHMKPGLLDSSWTSYCKGASGESQRSVFYQGSQWNPMNGARTDGTSLITMTCESGSVAKCMSWGYRPWATGTVAGGQRVSLRDSHQACIHMKRASYCGDSKANTIDGTRIIVNDSLSPAINSGPEDILEARWTTSGATCVTNQRHPEILFIGCPLPLPTCTSGQSGGYLLTSALPSSGSLLGLIK